MDSLYITRPVRRATPGIDSEDFSGEAESPYLDEALAFDEATDPFDMYRHFHRSYDFEHAPYQSGYTQIAFPNRRSNDSFQRGDIILLRLVLSGRTVAGIVAAPGLRRGHELFPSGGRQKDGYYVQVTGGNDAPGYIRVSDANRITPPNVIVLRRNGVESEAAEAEYGEEGWEDYAEAAPTLISRESAPARETIYVTIDLGLRRECMIREGKPPKCVKQLKDDVEPKTGIYFPSAFNTATPEVDLLVYLHGHKVGFVKDGHDMPIDKLWDATRDPRFGLREVVNASGRPIIMVAPTLGPRSQPGSLTTGAGFTDFINQVLAAIGQFNSLYEGKPAPTVRKIILAAHSGGGDPMRRIARLTGSPYTALISECWGFDCTYSDLDPGEWHSWAADNPNKALHIFYIPNSLTAKKAEPLQAKRPQLSNINVVRSSTGDHNSVPKVYLRERLFDANVPTEAFDEEDEGCRCGCGEEDNYLYENGGSFSEEVPPPIAVTEAPMQVANVPFAPTPAAGSFWPLRTSNRNGRLVSYTTINNTTIGNGGRKFMARRDNRTYKGSIAKYRDTKQNRWHVGIDLFAKIGDEVVACEAGKIIHLQYFYKANSGQHTYGIFVEHAGCVVNYGEVTGDSLVRNHLREGDNVTAGQVIGFVSDTGMLHFETYVLREDHEYQNIQWWDLRETRTAPAGLLNPTQYLLFLQAQGQPTGNTAAESFDESMDEDLMTEDANTFCTEYGVLVAATQVKDQIAAQAQSELQWWRNAPGRQLMENTPEGRRRITSYWSNVRGAPAHTVPGTAWSAVFVSTCVKLAADVLGITPVPLYLSAGHFHYAKSAYNRRFSNPSQAGYYWAYDPADRVVQVGDIIVKERPQPNGRFLNLTFDDLRTRDGASTHGDIVVSLQTNPGIAQVIGGNVSNSVRQNEYRLTADGRIDTTQTQYSGNRVFAVLSLQPFEGCVQPAMITPRNAMGTLMA